MTLRATFIATVQVLDVPIQAPDQPANLEPEEATAVSVTEVEEAKRAVHLLPQLIPWGLEVTVPEPVPVLDTVNV